MELWVRSQDRTTLIKCSEIYIAEEQSYLIKEASSSHILGAYKTIDRALEVLDEIQRKIAFFNAMSTVHDTESFEKLCEAIGDENLLGLASPYQMPEE